MSIFLITLDIFFMASSVLAIFISICVLTSRVKQINRDEKAEQKALQLKATHIVPINHDEKEESDFNHAISKRHRRQRSVHSNETVALAHAIHDEFHESEIALRAEHKKHQQRQRRSTQNRVMARLKIRQTKALNRVPLFASIPPYRLATAIESILELTTYKKAFKNDVLCRQGEPANEFYIIVSGQCSVKVQVQEEEGKTPQERKVGTLKELDFFGESALVPGEHTRNATVVVDTEAVQVLMLSRKNFELLVAEEIINHDVVANVEQESERRKEMTRSRSTISRNFELPKGRPPVPTGKPPPPPPKMRPKLKGGSGGVKGGVDL